MKAFQGNQGSMTTFRSHLFASLALTASLCLPFAAFAGGVGDGGGNIKPEDSLSAREITDLLAQAKEPAKYIFRQLEFISSAETSSSPYDAINTKLFRGKNTVYQALKDAQFTPIPSGGCETVGGSEADASALKHAPQICFSLENLSKKLDHTSGKIELMALVIHEVSHLVGTTEPEARLLQSEVQSLISSRIFEVAKDAVPTYKNSLDEAIGTAEWAQDLLKPESSFKEFCNAGVMMMSNVTAVNNLNSAYLNNPGILIPSPRNVWAVSDAMMRAVNIANACFEGQSNLALTAAFKGQKTIPAQDAYKAIFGNTSNVFGSKAPVPNLENKDRATIKLEIQRIVKSLKATQADLN